MWECAVSTGNATWFHASTVETQQSVLSLAELLNEADSDFRSEISPESPAGCHWFEIFVDESLGTLHCTRTVCRLLGRLLKMSADGVLPNFRIISGEHWLAVGAEIGVYTPIKL
jgi:hypothetical protein